MRGHKSAGIQGNSSKSEIPAGNTIQDSIPSSAPPALPVFDMEPDAWSRPLAFRPDYRSRLGRMRSRFAAFSACASCAPSGRGRTDALRASKKEAWRGRSDGGEIAPYRQRPCGLLSRRAKPITARATGLRLRRIFPKAEKPPIATLSLMQFALSAVIFGLRRGEGRPCPRCARFRPRLRRVEQRAIQGRAEYDAPNPLRRAECGRPQSPARLPRDT